jgi:transcriptional regulator with GAF, ATPase, and Fis domain
MGLSFTEGMVGLQGLSGLALAGVSAVVFLRNRVRSVEIQLFALMTGTAALWVLIDSVRVMAAFAGGPVHLISPVGGMFVVYTGTAVFCYAAVASRAVLNPVRLFAILPFALLASVFAWSSDWAFNRRFEHGVPVADFGWAYLVTAGSAFVQVAAGLVLLGRAALKESHPVSRHRLLYSFSGILLFVVFAYFFSLVLPALNLRHLFFLGPSSGLLFVFVMLYAALTRRVFDLRLTLHRFLAGLVLLLLLAGWTHGLLLALEHAGVKHFARALLASGSLFALFSIFWWKIFPAVESRFLSVRSAEGLTTDVVNACISLASQDFDRVCAEVSRLLRSNLQLKYVGIVLPREDGKWRLTSTGSAFPGGVHLVRKHRHIFRSVMPKLYAAASPDTFRTEDIARTEETLLRTGHMRALASVRGFAADLSGLQIDVCVPVIYQDRFLACFLLGRKVSGAAFYTNELQILSTLTRVLAVGLHNVHAYQSVARDNMSLHKQNQRLLESSNLLTERIVQISEGRRILYASASMHRVMEMTDRAAQNDATVLLLGESGTGKELVAALIHEKSERKNKNFIAINCGAFNEGILQSELFGHEAGAFTGALRAHRGVFEQASGGTLFLDEIGEMPLPFQVHLLRVLQDRKVSRIGGAAVPVDVRIIAATNRDLETMVQESKFRLDLYHRLNVLRITLPPLRQRRDDISHLVLHYTDAISRKLGREGLVLDPAVLRAMKDYDWPGNIRELENMLVRGIVGTQENRLTLVDFPELTRRPAEVSPGGAGLLREVEVQSIVRALQNAGGNKSEAARTLGLSRTALYDKIRRHGLGV